MNFTSLLPVLVELLIKSGAILLAATLIDRAWRGASAAQRHAIWLAAFIALLLLPATRLIAPRWNLASPPRAHVIVRTTVEPLSASANLNEPVPVPVATVSVPTRSFRVEWRALAMGLWVTGSAVLLGRRILGSMRLRSMLRASGAAHDAQLSHARRIAAEFGVTRSIDLRVSPACRVPLTWGTWRPVLMLPEDCAAWPGHRLLAALRHELAHIRRGDFAVRLLGDVVRALYWPNPLVWFASRALRTAQEQACDDLVLNAGTCPTDYATLLCEAARRFAAPHSAVAMAQPSTLESRVLSIIDAARDRSPLSMRTTMLGLVCVALSLAASTVAQLRAAEQALVAAEPADPATVAIGAAPIPAPVPDKAPQIRIEAKFIEVSPDADTDAMQWLFQNKAVPPLKPLYLIGVLSDSTFQTVSKLLDTTKGIKILSNPRVLTRSKQNATMDIGQELRYATAWEKSATRGIWQPTAFATKNCGPKLEIRPEASARDQTIDLTLRSQIVEFLGYTDLDTGKPVPASNDEPNAEGLRRKPVFSTRDGEVHAPVFAGQTVLLELTQAEGVKTLANKSTKGRLLVFLTISPVLPNGEKVPVPAVVDNRPRVAVEAWFVDVNSDNKDTEALISSLGIASKPERKSPDGTLFLSEASINERLFGIKKAAGIFSTPKVTTLSGQRAVIEIIEEYRYATEWKKGTKVGTWKPAAFETTATGTTLEAEPVIQGDGTIVLRAVPQVVDFLGFINLETGESMPLGTVGNWLPMSEAIRFPNEASSLEGPRLKAVFSRLKLDTKIVLKSGETAVLGPLKQWEAVKGFEDRVRKTRTMVFVTATALSPTGERLGTGEK